MKNAIALLIATLLITSCGGEEKKGENQAPIISALIFPENNQLCTSHVLTLEWEAAEDMENDRITYKIEISKSNTFQDIYLTTTTSLLEKEVTLEIGEAYYWRIKATDDVGNSSSYSEVGQFYTEGAGITNHLPFLPKLVSPEMDAVISESIAILEWTASDVDNDSLTYDVFFGVNEENLAAVSSSQSDTSYQTSNLSVATNYYWRVDVKDVYGAKTIGKIWSFQTD